MEKNEDNKNIILNIKIMKLKLLNFSVTLLFFFVISFNPVIANADNNPLKSPIPHRIMAKNTCIINLVNNSFLEFNTNLNNVEIKIYENGILVEDNEEATILKGEYVATSMTAGNNYEIVISASNSIICDFSVSL